MWLEAGKQTKMKSLGSIQACFAGFSSRKVKTDAVCDRDVRQQRSAGFSVIIYASVSTDIVLYTHYHEFIPLQWTFSKIFKHYMRTIYWYCKRTLYPNLSSFFFFQQCSFLTLLHGKGYDRHAGMTQSCCSVFHLIWELWMLWDCKNDHHSLSCFSFTPQQWHNEP